MNAVSMRALLVLIALLSWPLRGHAEAIDLMRFSRIGDDAKIELELGCEMRQEDFYGEPDGLTWTVNLDLGMDCRLPLRNTRNELHRPPGGRLADLAGINFERRGMRDATIVLNFEHAVDVAVEQTANRYMLTFAVRKNVIAPVVAVRPEAPTIVPTEPTAQPATSDRFSRRVDNRPSEVRNRFVIRLAVLTEEWKTVPESLRAYGDRTLYTQNIEVGDREWIELKLGFFDSEAEARRTATALATDFESAWITVANPEEQHYATEHQINDVERAGDAAPAAVAAGPALRAAPSLSADEVAAMLADARNALVRRDFETSISLYLRLLEEPAGDHRRTAREFLGVARAKVGEQDAAAAEFRAYLQEFPDGEQSDRVRQRLSAVAPPAPANASPGLPDRAVTAIERPEWEYYAGMSQYYLRGVNMAGNSDPNFVAQSALLTQANLYVRHRGDRFDVIGRATPGYLYDFRGEGESQALVSTAYLDVTDIEHEVHARIGRQRQLSGGVLGLFDGAHVSYQWKPDWTVAVTAGFPIDSPRYLASSDHTLYGASVTVDNVIDAWDVTVFANMQRVDGILDRQAVGLETQYQSRSLVVVGLLDYDSSYNIINTMLANATWRASDRLTIYGRARGGAAPFLTTRNAIIGQPVNTVRELFDTYSEGQIRRLARNRTADERAASAGLSLAVTERLQLKAETSYLEYSATVASGGVAAIPASGPRYSWGGHLQGSGYVKPGTVFLAGYRHDETQSIDTDTAWFDLRYPLGERLRLQTRLSASLRVADQDVEGDIEQWVVNPMVRVQYASEGRWQIDFEAGSQWSNQEFPLSLQPPLITDGDIAHSDYYLQLGYTVDFE